MDFGQNQLRNAMSTTISQQILNGRLLHVVSGRAKSNFNDKFKLEPTTNDMNAISDTISVCSVERNRPISTYRFRFQIYIYIYIYNFIFYYFFFFNLKFIFSYIYKNCYFKIKAKMHFWSLHFGPIPILVPKLILLLM